MCLYFCVYLSMYLFMLYDCLCLWFVYVWYVYLFICWFVICTIYVCLIICWSVIYAIYVWLIMCCFATSVHCYVFLKISSRLMIVRVQGRIKANVCPKHRRPLMPRTLLWHNVKTNTTPWFQDIIVKCLTLNSELSCNKIVYFWVFFSYWYYKPYDIY